MELKEYQQACMLFAKYRRDSQEPDQKILHLGYPTHVTYGALSLAAEAGEVAGEVSKAIRDDGLFATSDTFTPERFAKIKEELGDTFWHLAVLASELGWTLEDLAASNIEKLADRYPDANIR